MKLKCISAILSFSLYVCFNQFATAAPATKASPSLKSKAPAPAQEIVVESVIASVNGKPISLQDLGRRLNPPRQLSLREAASDAEARHVLDQIIFERLILEEAEARHLKAGDSEINAYFDELAKQNNMTRAQFEQALKAEHPDISKYKEQVRFEILKSRLAGQLVQGGAGVTKAEIDEYLSKHPELSKSGTKLRLRQIYVSSKNRSSEATLERVQEVQKELSDGTSFSDVAIKYSEGPEAAEGGSLGILAQEDLNPTLFDSVFGLEEGEVSKPVELPDGYRLFQLEKRYVEEGQQDERLLNEVKRTLETQKMDSKMQTFFTSDLMKAHSVERKL